METQKIELAGLSLIEGQASEHRGAGFYGVNPATGSALETTFYSATSEDLAAAAKSAKKAFPIFAALSGRERAAFLRTVADEISRDGATIIERANLETGLPLPRLQGELARTTGQLKMFAQVLEEGSWVDARIDYADRERKPLPKPDLRSMLRPLGPVAVFGASNFPLAYSVAGGDTASAFAAGNPVIVKAHTAHPGTSEIVGRAVLRAIEARNLPAGIFALLFDAGIEVGVALVQHPAVKAVGFTGSVSGGQALMRLASGRPEPIPCYAEMGSTNPIFIMPGAMTERGAAIAQGLQNSFTLGSGQFCTKPGLVFTPKQKNEEFLTTLQSGVETLGQYGMLTAGIAAKYNSAVRGRLNDGEPQAVAGSKNISVSDTNSAVTSPIVFSTSLEDFLQRPALEEEIFGPTTLIVHYGNPDDLLNAARSLHGHLTATIHGTEEDLANAGELIRTLETKAGRILFNGYPTGVEVCHAMVHGGPFPATSDGRSTSVGPRAMLRFTRPVCYQDFPDAALPPELQQANPLGILRIVDGVHTR